MRGASIEARFWSKVPNTDDPMACWYWGGRIDPRGYGRFDLPKEGRCKLMPWLAHRVSFLLTRGSLSSSAVVCHKCDNTRCVNPSHLFVGSQADNLTDMKNKGRGNGKRKLSIDDVLEILKSNETHSVLGEKYGVSRANIYHIKLGHTWSRRLAQEGHLGVQ